jgi:dTDP-glucose 4,6-dehydratase
MKNLDEFRRLPNFQFYHDDICNPSLPDDLFSDVESIVNFAAESHVDRSINSSSEFIKTNITGTHNLLNKALQNNVSKFLQVSTDEVYGSIRQGSWDENFQLHPSSPYAASKASADLLVESFNRTYGLHTNITRCSNNYGTHQYPEKMIPIIINNLLAGHQIPIYGDGLNSRDWLHVQDHCKALKSVMLNARSGEVYNVGGGTELTNLALVRRIIQLMGASDELISFVQDRKGHDFRYSVSSKKLESDLGYKPEKDLDTSFVEVINWYKNNPNWWDQAL